MDVLTLDEALKLQAAATADKINRLQALVRYWKGYPCKFDGRKNLKDTFEAGFKAGNGYHSDMYDSSLTKAINIEWTQHEENENARTQTSNSE